MALSRSLDTDTTQCSNSPLLGIAARLTRGVRTELTRPHPGGFVPGVWRRIRRGRGKNVPRERRQTVLPQGVPEKRLWIGRRRFVVPLHPLPPPVVPMLEHVLVLRIQGPVVPLALAASLSRHLHEALVQTEIVPDGVLPPLPVPLEVRKLGDNVRVDFREGGSVHVRGLDRHGDQRHVRVRGLAIGGCGGGGGLRLRRLAGAGARRACHLLGGGWRGM